MTYNITDKNDATATRVCNGDGNNTDKCVCFVRIEMSIERRPRAERKTLKPLHITRVDPCAVACMFCTPLNGSALVC